MTPAPPFNVLLRQARVRAGLSQGGVAALVRSATGTRCSQQAVTKWEAGKSLPRPATMRQLGILLKFEHSGMDVSSTSAPSPASTSSTRDSAITRACHDPLYAARMVREAARHLGNGEAAIALFMLRRVVLALEKNESTNIQDDK